MLPKLISLLLTLALLGSSAAHAATVNLRAGQTTSLNGARVTLVKFNDSRCPPAALCIRAGDVSASVFVAWGKTSRLFTVFLPGRPVQTPAGSLKLTAATRPGEGRAPQVLTFSLE